MLPSGNEGVRVGRLCEKTSNIEKHRDKIEDAIYYAHKHKQIIEKFGRFPHRNKILKRESTREELDFLSNEGINFGQ